MADETVFRFILEDTDQPSAPGGGGGQSPAAPPPPTAGAGTSQRRIAPSPPRRDRNPPMARIEREKPPKPAGDRGSGFVKAVSGALRAGAFASTGGVAGIGAAFAEAPGIVAGASEAITGTAGAGSGLAKGLGIAAAALGSFTLAVRAVDGALENLASRAGEFSGPVAAAQARGEANRIQFEMDEARRMGPELARFTESRNELSIELDRFRNHVLENLLEVAVPVTEFLRKVMEKFNAWLDGEEERRSSLMRLLGLADTVDKVGERILAHHEALAEDPIGDWLGLKPQFQLSDSPVGEENDRGWWEGPSLLAAIGVGSRFGLLGIAGAVGHELLRGLDE